MAATAHAPGTPAQPVAMPAWHVRVEWMSTISRVGWFRTSRNEDRTFRTHAAAVAYAKAKTGLPSILVPFMHRRGTVVETTRPYDRRDRIAAFLRRAFGPAAPAGGTASPPAVVPAAPPVPRPGVRRPSGTRNPSSRLPANPFHEGKSA